MGQWRGFGALYRYLKLFLEEHGYRVHLGAWCDVYKGSRHVADIVVGHWAFVRPPRRGVKSIWWATTEGRVHPRAREWHRGWDYIFAQTKYVQRRLEEVGIHSEVVYGCTDTRLFRPMNVPKLVDVLSVGIWEGPFDDRKFMQKVVEVAWPYSVHVHTRSCARYEDLPLLYNQARVYLSLSGCEGFNIPVLEAMACGLPIVYNKAPPLDEFAVGVGVPPARVEDPLGIPAYNIHYPDFARIREELHKLLQDPRRMRRLGEQARRRALEFDYRRTLRRFLEVLE